MQVKNVYLSGSIYLCISTLCVTSIDRLDSRGESFWIEGLKRQEMPSRMLTGSVGLLSLSLCDIFLCLSVLVFD